ncbi:MAG: DUF3343 domain-containing protein [Clostridiales bacterium]|nr:DUF3343 domain-containing protein [Candidatus Equinaster intestinalis]
MEKYSIATGTVTAAIRGRDLLRNNGIKAYIERSSAPDKIGCGYTVVAQGNLQTIKELLEKSGIKIHDVKTI